MALNPSQQILELLKRSKRPLICVPQGGGVDGHATALGLYQILRALETNPTIVSAEGKLPKNLRFLSAHGSVNPSLENLQQFIIELDATKTAVDELSYEMKDGRLFVYLSPKKGFWKDEDVKTTATGFRYDLIVTVGAPDLESFAHLFEEYPSFFFETPIINIDHSPENEQYGQINVVDLTATACGEVAHDLAEEIEPGLVDEVTATCFLAGMIAKTKSFKSRNVTPKTLQTASKLIAKGAKRDTIVEHLYRTRSVNTLRLWGRALARLKSDAETKITWTLLSRQDFMHAGAEEEDLPDVIEELITSSPDAKVAVLLYEDREGSVSAIVHADAPLDAIQLTGPFKSAGTREEARLSFSKDSIIQAEKKLIGHLKNTLSK